MLTILKYRVKRIISDFAYWLIKVTDSDVFNQIYVVFTHEACGSKDILPTDELGGRKWNCGECMALLGGPVRATLVDPLDPEVARAIRTGSFPVYRL